MANGSSVSGEDQGTIVMFSLTFMLAVAASIWFACNWYRKRRRKRAADVIDATTKKQRVKQTFSRFSQVDEELTMHNVDATDAEILQAHVAHNVHDTPAAQEQHSLTNTAEDATANVDKGEQLEQTPLPTVQTQRPPYLETDL